MTNGKPENAAQDATPDVMLAIPKSQAQTLMDYIVKQPFNQVFNLVPILMQLKPIEAAGAASHVTEVTPEQLRDMVADAEKMS